MGAKLNLYIHINLLKSADESEKTPATTSTNRKNWKQFVWIVSNLNIIFLSRISTRASVRLSEPINFACILHLPAVNVLWVSLYAIWITIYIFHFQQTATFFNTEEFMASHKK